MKRLIYGVSVVALVLAASFSFSSCNDYVQDQLTELKGDSKSTFDELTKELDEIVKAYDKEIEDLQTGLAATDLALIANAAYAEATYAKIADLNETRDSLESLKIRVADLEERMDVAEDSISNYYNYISELYSLYETVETAYAKIGHNFDENGNIIVTQEMADAIYAANKAKTEAMADSIVLSKGYVDTAYLNAQGYVDTTYIQNIIDEAMARIKAQRAKADSVHNAILNIADSIHTIIMEKIEDIYGQIDDVKSELSELTDDFDTFRSYSIEAIALLQDQIDALKGSYDKQITSIILQGTYNNVFGSINLPFDIQSMLVAGHYGQLLNPVDFPEELDGITADNHKNIPANEVVKEDAGFAYLTINPNTVDITGVDFKLVNSLDQEIGFNVDVEKDTTTKLTFGWTRANNGFYRAAISLDENTDINSVKPRIDFSDIKDVAKTAINDLRAKKMFDLSSVARVIYENSSDILDATAIKATWTDNFGEEHSVYTNYDMAATVMKPLSFQFEGFDKAADSIVSILRKYSLRTIDPFAFDFNINIDSFQLHPLNDSIYPIKITYTDGTVKTIDGFANLKAFIEDVNAYYVGQTEDEVNRLINQIKTQAKNEFNRALNQINNNYVARINNYVTKFNNYYTKFLNKIGDTDFNHYLQPTMLIGDKASHIGFVSTNAQAPSFVKADKVILTPTSYTAELLAPAMYKYVAVAKVTKDNGQPAAGVAEQCNKSEYNMNVVFPGKQEVILQLPEKNALYEINYQAVDFSGCTVEGTYYVYAL